MYVSYVYMQQLYVTFVYVTMDSLMVKFPKLRLYIIYNLIIKFFQ